MRYKIEIWQYHSIVETYETDSLQDALNWYRSNWDWCYNNGGCAVEVYREGIELSWDECNELGFY